MIEELNQGDILRIDHIKVPVLIVSKNYFNQSGTIIGCPIIKGGTQSALHICISTNKVDGFVHCEKMTLFDMNIRRFQVVDRANLPDIINITDAIQGIFDYI